MNYMWYEIPCITYRFIDNPTATGRLYKLVHPHRYMRIPISLYSQVEICWNLVFELIEH